MKVVCTLTDIPICHIIEFYNIIIYLFFVPKESLQILVLEIKLTMDMKIEIKKHKKERDWL